MTTSNNTLTPAKFQALKNFTVNSLGVHVIKIDSTWNCCKYRYRVFVDDTTLGTHYELLPVLEKIFGGAVFLDASLHGYSVYLCSLKNGCENTVNLYNK